MTDTIRLREVQVPEWTVTTEGEGFKFCYVSCCDGEPYVPAAESEALRARVATLEAGLRGVIGMLDDPTGAEHVRDMRGATVIARAALEAKP